MTTKDLGKGDWESGEHGQASKAQGLIQTIVSVHWQFLWNCLVQRERESYFPQVLLESSCLITFSVVLVTHHLGELRQRMIDHSLIFDGPVDKSPV